MALKLFNTLTRQKEDFTSSGLVNIYACGPTPYDYAHIGNLRTYVFNDILRRVLTYNNYEVKQVMNVTDVDDKTIKASQEQNIPLDEYTKKYEDLFFADLDKLNIKRPDLTPHATSYIPQMIALIKVLLAKKVAYKAPDGVYFALGQVKNYGQLSGRLSKNEPLPDENFALWKFEKPEDGGVAWEAPFGRGRPGWHIECSAMAEATIGSTVDIHTGGTDLIFPHHENEIAQSEAAHDGKPLARYWLHGGFVNVSDEKMSKSLGNFVTLQTLQEHDLSPLAYRYWLLTAHYRTTVNFTWEAVTGAQNALDKLKNILVELPTGEVNQKQKAQFLELINDDLNMPRALAFALSEVEDRATWFDFDKVFGLGLANTSRTDLDIPEAIQKLVAEREEARKNQDWPKADDWRKKIEQSGYQVKDTETGPKVSQK